MALKEWGIDYVGEEGETMSRVDRKEFFMGVTVHGSQRNGNGRSIEAKEGGGGQRDFRVVFTRGTTRSRRTGARSKKFSRRNIDRHRRGWSGSVVYHYN